MTDQEFKTLKDEAYGIKMRFRGGSITIGEAKKLLKPFEKEFNFRSKEKAVRFGVKPQKLSILMWLNMDL